MAFEDLYKKYTKQPESAASASIGAKPVPEMQKETSQKQHTAPHRSASSKETPIIPKPVIEKTTVDRTAARRTVERTMDKVQPMPGSFGSDTGVTYRERESDWYPPKRKASFDFGRLSEWPWIDIIFILITIIMIVRVIVDFENITDKLFYMLLPFIANVFEVLLILVFFAALAWWWFNRRR